MANEITQQQYWAEINELAQDAFNEKDNYEDRIDYVHELVDGHQWVIYNAYHFDVLKHCSDENAYFENFGEAPTGSNVHEILIKLVYAAMEQDVLEALTVLESEAK
jgi:hypothetical protein